MKTAHIIAVSPAEDQAALTSALASTGTACKGCRDSYQVPSPARPAA